MSAARQMPPSALVPSDPDPERLGNGGNDSSTSSPADDDTDEPVVQFKSDQRYPAADEPVCVLCGRYGAYVCSDTDADVCSLECKADNLHLRRAHLFVPQQPVFSSSSSSSSSTARTHSTEESGPGSHAEKVSPKDAELRRRIAGVVSIQCVSSNTAPSAPSAQTDSLPNLLAETSIPVPVDTVPALSLGLLSATLEQNVTSALGATALAPVQSQALPFVTSGLLARGGDTPGSSSSAPSLLVSSPTGSGKSLCFSLPAVIHSIAAQRAAAVTQSTSGQEPEQLSRPSALILVPNRELCVQTEQQIKDLCLGIPNMKTALLAGGFPAPPQLHRLRRGVQIVVATPGRLIEILSTVPSRSSVASAKRESHPSIPLSWSSLSLLILDEADTFLLPDFRSQLLEIMASIETLSDASLCPLPRQLLAFSATFVDACVQLCRTVFSRFVRHDASTHRPPASLYLVKMGLPHVPSLHVKQTVLWVEEKSKRKRLLELLASPKHFRPPLLVFVNTKEKAEALALEICRSSSTVRAEHVSSERSPEDRAQVVARFSSGAFPVLVATVGVAGRGVQFKVSVKSVILYDMPLNLNDYIHCIGRAARWETAPFASGGQSGGASYCFINNDSKSLFVDFLELVEPQGVSLPSELLRSPTVFHHRERQRVASTNAPAPQHESRQPQQEQQRPAPQPATTYAELVKQSWAASLPATSHGYGYGYGYGYGFGYGSGFSGSQQEVPLPESKKRTAHEAFDKFSQGRSDQPWKRT